MLGEHYDPIHKRLVLSSENYLTSTPAVLGVAAFVTSLAYFLWDLLPMLNRSDRE